MKNLISVILLLTGLLFSSQACRKDSDITGQTYNVTRDTVIKSNIDTVWDEDLAARTNSTIGQFATQPIEQLVNNFSSVPMKDTFNAERGGLIKLADSTTILEFPANACVFANSTRLCTGRMDVEVLILRKKGDLVMYNLPTVSINKTLFSGGVVRVIVKKNGIPVEVAENKTYRIQFTSNTAPDRTMGLFEGKFDGRFKFDWKEMELGNLGQSTRPTLATWADSSNRTSGYNLRLDRFNYINCDRFDTTNAVLTKNLSVKLTDTFTNLNTQVYVVFKDINSVISLSGNSRTKLFEVNSSYRGLPVGRRVTIVSVSLVRDKYFIGTSSEIIISTTASNPIRITPIQMTLEAAKQVLSNL